MQTGIRLATFAVGLAALFGAALALGSGVDPILAAGTTSDDSVVDGTDHDTDHGTSGTGGTGGDAEPDADGPGGLEITSAGYTLALTSPTSVAGAATELAFEVVGPDGAPVTAYEEAHEQDLHLIVVRRDLSGFQHVHPTLDAGGTWRTELALDPGTWRVFADFVPTATGEQLVLGADLAVPGSTTQVELPAPATSTEIDGYTVTLDGDLRAGEESELVLTITRDGEPVDDLDPYLGAYGHLVALRAGDLAYLHVHPTGEPKDGTTTSGPDVTFAATAPSVGTYRLYLDFQHQGVVRTAAFTVSTTDDPGTAATPATPKADPSGDGHSDH